MLLYRSSSFQVLCQIAVLKNVFDRPASLPNKESVSDVLVRILEIKYFLGNRFISGQLLLTVFLLPWRLLNALDVQWNINKRLLLMNLTI